jgi:hypothetical protein
MRRGTLSFAYLHLVARLMHLRNAPGTSPRPVFRRLHHHPLGRSRADDPIAHITFTYHAHRIAGIGRRCFDHIYHLIHVGSIVAFPCPYRPRTRLTDSENRILIPEQAACLVTELSYTLILRASNSIPWSASSPRCMYPTQLFGDLHSRPSSNHTDCQIDSAVSFKRSSLLFCTPHTA